MKTTLLVCVALVVLLSELPPASSAPAAITAGTPAQTEAAKPSEGVAQATSVGAGEVVRTGTGAVSYGDGSKAAMAGAAVLKGAAVSTSKVTG